MKILQKVTELKAELDSLLPMKKEDKERLWKKFRLEWNYNSNHIEGNTLTYGQTELLIIFDKAVGDHDFREFEEMKAHDTAIKLVQELAKDENGILTLDFIKYLNKVILVKPFWKKAFDPNDQETRRLIKIGDFKEFPNSVRLQNGEMFYYALPIETPALMGELIDWYREYEKEGMHPLELAAKLHYKFVRIHPFDDGNGRVSRLLMNFVLLKNGYPPVIVKTSDDKSYYLALNKADTGDINAFIEYIGNELEWSLDKNINAARGGRIDDPDDVDKEIALIKNKIQSLKNKSKTDSVVKQLFNDYFFKFFDLYFSKSLKFKDLYNSVSISYTVGSTNRNLKENESITDYMKTDVSNGGSINSVKIGFNYDIFKGIGKLNFNFSSEIRISFNDLNYIIGSNKGGNIVLTKNYNQGLSDNEINEVIQSEIKAHTDFINLQIEKTQNP